MLCSRPTLSFRLVSAIQSVWELFQTDIWLCENSELASSFHSFLSTWIAVIASAFPRHQFNQKVLLRIPDPFLYWRTCVICMISGHILFNALNKPKTTIRFLPYTADAPRWRCILKANYLSFYNGRRENTFKVLWRHLVPKILKSSLRPHFPRITRRFSLYELTIFLQFSKYFLQGHQKNSSFYI